MRSKGGVDGRVLRRLVALDLSAWRAAPAGAPPSAPASALPSGPPDAGPGLPRSGPVWVVPGVTPPAPSPTAGPLVSAVQRAVDALAQVPPSGRAVEVAAVLVLAERLRGLALRELAELESTGGYAEHGAPTAAAWLRRTAGVGEDSARAAVRLAVRLRQELPQVAGLLQAGGTTLEHVRACAAGTAGLDPELVGQAQDELCALLQAGEPGVVRRQLRERAEAICPELGRDADRRQRARQGLFADQVPGVGVLLGGSLCQEDGAVLLHALDLCVQADRTTGDTRALPARRADILVGWARSAATALAGPGDSRAADAHTVRSHLLITCTAGQLTDLASRHAHTQLGQLDQTQALAVLTGRSPLSPPALPTGASLLPEHLRRLACDTTLTLVLTGQPPTSAESAAGSTAGAGGSAVLPDRAAPLYVGRSARTVTAAQFTALVVRDRHCTARGCTRRPAQCAAHHVQHWLDGGPTDLDNLVLLCHRHHHDHHDRGHHLQHHDGRWITTTGWAHDPP